MSVIETIKMAIAGVTMNKFRTFLTLLGIIIGVASVILMVSLGSGTQQVVGGQFAGLEQRQIIVSPNYDLDYYQWIHFTLDDGTFLKESTIGTKDVLPFVRYYLPIEYSTKEIKRSVQGVMPETETLSNIKLKHGRFIMQSDLDNRERVVVIGEEILERLVDVPDDSVLIGKPIELDNKKFTIVGIIEKGNTTVMLGPRSVVVPLTTARDLWKRWDEDIEMYLISYDQSTTEKDISAQIEELLTAKYGKTSTGKNRYRIEGLQQMVNIMTTVVEVFTYLLGGIAGIALLVGGIGVMNIMLVTVKERTREIGIRLSIGATKQNVQYQFLLEATIMAVVGGIIGILVGSSLSLLVDLVLSNMFEWWQGSLPAWVIFLSFGVTVFIGIVFGFYPAYKASKLDPIEALRHK